MQLEEETGLAPGREAFAMEGYVNSDSEDVSSVHFGVVFTIDLDGMPGDDDELMKLVSGQAEPHQARWIAAVDCKRCKKIYSFVSASDAS